MARGPIYANGVKRLSKKRAGHLPIPLKRGQGACLVDVEGALMRVSDALLKELEAELGKPEGERNVGKLLQIERRLYEWVVAMREREKREAAAKAGAPGEPAPVGDAADPAGEGPEVGVLEAFRRGAEAGGGGTP